MADRAPVFGIERRRASPGSCRRRLDAAIWSKPRCQPPCSARTGAEVALGISPWAARILEPGSGGTEARGSGGARLAQEEEAAVVPASGPVERCRLASGELPRRGTAGGELVPGDGRAREDGERQRKINAATRRRSLAAASGTCPRTQEGSLTGRMVNRLAQEASPYLQQHAHNPVDWYPWGPEALERARRENRPILLSIGYSACHWCHVMERESFEDEAIAAQMNQWFVNVKVDREERPDLDQVYQLVVQLMGRSGGWPLTVFLTPDQKPFFGGTYFPPADRYGMPGFPKVLKAIREAYDARRDEVNAQSAELVKAIAEVRHRRRARARLRGIALARAARRARRRSSSPASTTTTGASASVRSSPTRCRSTSCSAEACSRRMTAPRRARRSTRCAPAGFGITSAEASTATRPTSGGSCRTSRRCSTTTRSSCASTSTAGAPSATTSVRRDGARDRRVRRARDAVARRRLLRDAGRGQRRARRGGSSCGRRRRSTLRAPETRRPPARRSTCGGLPRRATSRRAARRCSRWSRCPRTPRRRRRSSAREGHVRRA